MTILQRGFVKSVQRGTKHIDYMSKNSSISIDISPVNPNKSLLIIDLHEGGDNTLGLMYFNLLQSSIVIATTYNSTNTIPFTLSYQVIEFY